MNQRGPQSSAEDPKVSLRILLFVSQTTNFHPLPHDLLGPFHSQRTRSPGKGLSAWRSAAIQSGPMKDGGQIYSVSLIVPLPNLHLPGSRDAWPFYPLLTTRVSCLSWHSGEASVWVPAQVTIMCPQRTWPVLSFPDNLHLSHFQLVMVQTSELGPPPNWDSPSLPWLLWVRSHSLASIEAFNFFQNQELV